MKIQNKSVAAWGSKCAWIIDGGWKVKVLSAFSRAKQLSRDLQIES